MFFYKTGGADCPLGESWHYLEISPFICRQEVTDSGAGSSLVDLQSDCKTLSSDWPIVCQTDIVLCQIFHFVRTPQWRNVIIEFMCFQMYSIWLIKYQNLHSFVWYSELLMKAHIVILRSKIEMVKLKHESDQICRLRYISRISEWVSIK